MFSLKGAGLLIATGTASAAMFNLNNFIPSIEGLMGLGGAFYHAYCIAQKTPGKNITVNATEAFTQNLYITFKTLKVINDTGPINNVTCDAMHNIADLAKFTVLSLTNQSYIGRIETYSALAADTAGIVQNVYQIYTLLPNNLVINTKGSANDATFMTFQENLIDMSTLNFDCVYNDRADACVAFSNRTDNVYYTSDNMTFCS